MPKKEFDYQQDFTQTVFQKHPEKYQVGRGEQGVLLVEPYKGEILPWWRYKDEESATQSAKKIYQLFEEYRQKDDFVGMDMARKFIHILRRYGRFGLEPSQHSAK